VSARARQKASTTARQAASARAPQAAGTTPLALAQWAAQLEPAQEDLELARRALCDTVAVMAAARGHPVGELAREVGETGRWAALAHVLDFDDLHLSSTTHISAICVPAALAAGGGERAYLAGAGAMARLGAALGWSHYRLGWHATCTAGAPAAAIGAATAFGLDAERTAAALALAVPAAGGVQRAFGTAAKALQVAFAAEAGVRAARLARAGASADPRALEEWLPLVGGDPARLALDGPAVPGGLAIKLYPCCYALQRPISALLALGRLPAAEVRAVRVRTPRSSLAPLIHAQPRTGLEAKFSLQYGLAATLLDGPPGIESFTDAAVARPEAQRLAERIRVEADREGDGLLAGEVEIEVELAGGERRRTQLAVPPGAPDRPPTGAELAEKLRACAGAGAGVIQSLDFASAAAYVRCL
jgi:2-methylcitrate dehydratase PrpD